jgi:hypothetical protein
MNEKIYTKETSKGRLKYRMGFELTANGYGRYARVFFRFPAISEIWLHGTLEHDEENGYYIHAWADADEKKKVGISIPDNSPIIGEMDRKLYEGKKHLAGLQINLINDKLSRDYLYAFADSIGVDECVDAESAAVGTFSDGELLRLRRLISEIWNCGWEIGYSERHHFTSTRPWPAKLQGPRNGREIDKIIKDAYSALSSWVTAQEDAGRLEKEWSGLDPGSDINSRCLSILRDISAGQLPGTVKIIDSILEDESTVAYIDTGFKNTRTISVGASGGRFEYVPNLSEWFISRAEEKEMQDYAKTHEEDDPLFALFADAAAYKQSAPV